MPVDHSTSILATYISTYSLMLFQFSIFAHYRPSGEDTPAYSDYSDWSDCPLFCTDASLWLHRSPSKRSKARQCQSARYIHSGEDCGASSEQDLVTTEPCGIENSTCSTIGKKSRSSVTVSLIDGGEMSLRHSDLSCKFRCG